MTLPASLPELNRPAISRRSLMLMVFVLAVFGATLVWRFAGEQEKREVLHWQNKLGLIADSRTADVDGWLDRHFRELGDVAANPSLQLYLTELANTNAKAKAPGGTPEEPAQAVFLRNLLIITADRLGFLDAKAKALAAVNANVRKPTGTGLAILDKNGGVIVSTEGLAAIDPQFAARLKDAPRGQPELIDYTISPASPMRLGFSIPIYPIQGDATPGQQIGTLVGVKEAGEDLFRLLRQPGASEKTLTAELIRRDGENVIYLTPQEDRSLTRQLSLSTPDLDAAYALTAPGDFALKRDPQGKPVLMTSRTVQGAPWVLLLHIDRNEALSESDSWRTKTETMLALALLASIACIVAVWWYGTSQRAMLLSAQTGRLASHAMAQEKLLRLVTDNQPETVFIADRRHIVRFANARAAKFFGLAANEVVGKELTALLGPARAKDYIEASNAASKADKSLSHTHRTGEDIHARILRSEHIPLGHIPIDGLPSPTPGVLVIDQDITDIMSERERRVRTLHQLIDTLLRMMDARDPHAAGHSASVAMVAREVAIGLGLEPVLIDTAETAGNLMNIGKVVVPSGVLTKRATLGEDEVQSIRDALMDSASVLEGIEFDGPVVETLRQAQERVDGTGPLGLRGEDILITARIIAVANAFIGMISPRSYRAPIGIEEATTLLLQDIDTRFDRRVVIALINFVENRQGKAMLSDLVMKKAS